MKTKRFLAILLSALLLGQITPVFAAEKIDFSTMEETDFKSGPFKEYAFIFELKDKISEKFMRNTTEFKVRALGTELDLENPSNSQVKVTVIDEQTEDIVTEYVESLGYTKDILIINVNPDFIVNFDILSIPNDENAGDINADGKVDLTDLSELSLAIIGDKTLTERQIKVADINGNGEADLPDLARLRQYLSKVIDSLESVSKNQSDNSKVIWETPQPEQPGSVNINEKEIAYSLYVALNNEQNKGCLFAVTPVFKIDNQFEYNGKTIAQYEEESDAEYQYYLHIGELIKIGDSLKYGEALYTTGTPEGEKWDKDYYDNTIERLGKDLISKYIIDGEFFREEAEKVWNNQPPTVCYDALITARMEYQKHMNEETVKKLSEQNIEYEFNNKDQLIIFITSEEFKSLNLENVQQYMLATNDTIDFVDD